MKNVKVILLAALLLLPLGLAFAGPSTEMARHGAKTIKGVVVPLKPTLYKKSLSESEMLAIINSEKGLLPVLVNADGAFLDEDQKARVVAAAVAQVKAKNNHRAHYNAAIVYATYPYKLGLDEEWRLGASDAANAIRHATIALNLSSDTPENVPYMYLVRGNVKADQGMGYDMREATMTVRDRKYAQEALADLQEVERLAPKLAPYYQMASLARVLGKKELSAKYQRLEQEKSEREAREKAAQRKAEKERSQHRVKRGLFRSVMWGRVD